jgi:hypothetical protein
MKDAQLFADQSIVRAIHFTNQWPQDEVVSLEEKEKSLIALTKVKNFALDLLQALTSAADAIWKTEKACDSFLLQVFGSEWLLLLNKESSIYKHWHRYVERVERWVKVVVDSEEKWKSLITMETPAVPATDVSLNSMAEASQTQGLFRFFAKIRTPMKPPVKIHIVTPLYLGKTNDLDWDRLQKRYTQTEMESLRAIANLVDEARTLFGLHEKTKIVKEKATGPSGSKCFQGRYYKPGTDSYNYYHYFMDEHLAQSLYYWNRIGRALLAIESFPSCDVQAADLTIMSKEEVVNLVKNMIMLADRAVDNFICSVRKNMNAQTGSWQAGDGWQRMLTNHWLQPLFSTRQAIYETAKAIGGLLVKMDTADERKVWMDIREGVQGVYEDWHRYVEEAENQVIVVVDSEETKQKDIEKIVGRLRDTVNTLLDWRLVKINYVYRGRHYRDISVYEWDYESHYYINEPLVKSLYKWFQVRAMLLDLETGSI